MYFAWMRKVRFYVCCIYLVADFALWLNADRKKLQENPHAMTRSGGWKRRARLLLAFAVLALDGRWTNADPVSDQRACDLDRCRAHLTGLVESAGLSDNQSALSEWQTAARALLGDRNRITLEGLDRHLFTRGGIEYALDPSIEAMGEGQNLVGIITAYRDLLRARGVDLIVVPVPSREEVYPDEISAGADPKRLVTPGESLFLRSLIDADVEIVDLREAFLDERGKHAELLYPKSEIHWGAYAIERAAAEIAPRVRRYVDASPHVCIQYTEKLTHITRQGDLVAYLSSEQAAAYPAETWDVLEVDNPDGTAYHDSDDSPVIVVGDSFTGRFSDRSGHLSAHLAKLLGIPITTLTTKGNAPQALRMLALRKTEYLNTRRVAVWVLSSVCLGDRYVDQWRMPPASAKPTP